VQIISTLKTLAKSIKKILFPQSIFKKEFKERIILRHKTFWNEVNAEEIRNTAMVANDPIEKWKNVRYWQRRLSNKNNAREFAKKHNCKVADLYWKGRNATEINFSLFLNKYVIRATIGHSSGNVFLINDGLNLMNNKAFDKDDINSTITEICKKDQNVEFLIEEFLQSENGEFKIPNDYKFYMFNGNIAAIQLINRLGPSKGFTTCYNQQWKQIANINTYYPKGSYETPPKCLDEMILKAKELSLIYEIFVRIDFYATTKGAVFGEFTPTPFMGNHYTPSAEKMFIKYWDKYCQNKV
jgi:hypothetical protein